MEGKVYLVGAGPGDVELLTVKARRVLEKADVLVYDNLVGKAVLGCYGAGKELICVGKTAGRHPIPQERINQILVEEAQKGKQVVRLKGGDPFLFGRGAEELEELIKYRIPYEVVPGVTSALSVPAYCGIPVTHRDYASSLHIVTGHARSGEESKISYKELTQAGGTLVFLMGVTSLESIMSGLLKGGMRPDMPAAILQEGTTARQKKVTATITTLVSKALEADIKPPALIVVGEVCALSERLSWYEKKPLAGRRILLTRPKELMSVTAEKLREKGAEVLEVPAIETVPLNENLALERCLAKLEQYDWIVFTSQAGVRIFFEEMKRRRIDVRILHRARFAVIGEGTKKALAVQGIYADVMPDIYDGEHLGRALAEYGITGQKVVIPRAEQGNQELVPILKEAGAEVLDLPVYRTVYRTQADISVKEEIERGRVDYVIFTSSSTVEGFVNISGELDYSEVSAVCIGEQTARAAAGYGMKCYISEKATIDSVVELVERMKETDDKKAQKVKKQ